MQLDRTLLVALPLLAFGCDHAKPAPAPAGEKPAETSARANAPAAEKPAAEKPVAEKAKPQSVTRPLNVILITVDALRADMPWAGYARDIAPNLTRFAKDAVVFDQHRATTSFTAQSIPAMLSGRLASTLYRSGYFFAGYSDANEFMPEALAAKGVHTLAVQSHLYFNRGKGLNQGFDSWEMVPGITFNERTDENVTSDKTTDLFIQRLSEPKNVTGRFFAWTHFTDPHHQYVKHKESPDFGSSERDVYDNEVHFTDRAIGRFLSWAEKQSWWDKTAIIVSSDHGEAFGEHGLMQHAHELYEELVRVPLLIRVPGMAARRVATPHSHLDLAPTVLDLMGEEPLAGTMGKSLVSEIEGKPGQGANVIALELAADNVQPARRAIVAGSYKLIRFGDKPGAPEQLFNLEKDPGEKADLAKLEPKKLQELRMLLDQTFSKIPSVTPYGGMKLKGGGTANGPMRPELASRD